MKLNSPIRFIFLLLGLAFCAAHADTRKLDAQLGAQLQRYSLYKVSPLARAAESQSDVSLAVTVHFTGNALDEMRARGVQIRSVLGDIATVNVPLSQLAAISALPNVHRIESPRRPVARLDKSVPFTKANTLRTGSLAQGWGGLTGKGVLIGVIDTGIDITHSDFKDAQGGTRVVRLWNQRDVAGGTPPKDADGNPLYGAQCDSTAINAALKSSAANVCNPTDTGKHGTHVSGIAAGNGGATGNGQAVGRFVGMAPEAGLLVANAIDSESNSKNADTFLDAIAWMAGVAKELNRPLVINMSLGTYFGNRDGTGSTERAIDNISGPGVIIVAAAGNEGNAPIRTVLAPITQGQSASITFKVPPGRSAEQLEFWSNGGNRYAVQLICPNNANTTTWTLAPEASAQKTNVLADFDASGCGKVEVSSSLPSPTNGDRQYIINLSNGTSNALAAGGWVLNLRADTISVAGEKLGVISGEDADGAVFTGNFETTKTSGIITDTGSARRAITVASINTKDEWNSIEGLVGFEIGSIGDLSSSSSNGPRRLCSANSNYIDASTTELAKKNAYECRNPVMKPDLAAPGAYITSSLSKSVAREPKSSDIEADGVHVSLTGTSMAAPHVAGAVALMLQANPKLTPELAKQYLLAKVQSTAYSQAANLPTYSSGVEMPPSPNFSWGYGPMNVAASVVALSGSSVLVNTTTTSTTTTTSSSTTSTTSTSTSTSTTSTTSTSKIVTTTTTSSTGSSVTTTHVAATTTTTTTLGVVSLQLVKGWNLMGNGMDQSLNVASAFGDSSLFTTVWKWVASKSAWAFYAPSLNGSSLTTYASGKGYDVLSTVNAGEGFWVNAAQATTINLQTGSTQPTGITSSSFQAGASKALPTGWSLISIGDNKTPSEFNLALSAAPPTTNAAPLNLTTLWAWDAGVSNWLFFAPSLVNNGTLNNYITTKGYLPFGTKALSPSTGFWVNIP